jgi:hypothetical protein
VLKSAKLAKFMNYSDSFYFTTFTDYADYNYFADYVKTKILGIVDRDGKFSFYKEPQVQVPIKITQ